MEGYLGEIRLFGGNFAPKGWRICDGAQLNIRGNEALFSIIGNMYGGDGRANFMLPKIEPLGTVTRSKVNYIICIEGVFPERS